jgi:Na+/H+ antiporter NhaD/arsenite permease-like protein
MNTERPCRGEHLKGKVPELAHPVALSDAGKLAAGLAIATAILLASSSTGIPLGLPTCLAAVAAILLVTMKDRQAPIPVAQEVSWSMIPLVAGLLATILWLVALRREGFGVTAWTFLKIGVLVMPLALVTAVVALILCSSAH